MSPAVKVAAVVLAAAMFVGAGWAAEKIYEQLRFTKANLILEKYSGRQWTLPNGKKVSEYVTAATAINPNDPTAIEAAQRQHEEIKGLVAQKKYKLLKTVEDRFTGGMQYVYRFTLSDGTEHNMNFSMPLDKVDSWNDYLRKQRDQTQYYREQVNRAIGAGNYRLIDQDILLMHICLDRASQKKIRVQRISLPNGDEIALYHPYEIAAAEEAKTQPKSSWPDHLQAIRDGRLELLDAETIFCYTYELKCEDGTTRIFHHGGEKLLTPSAAK
jgi:hypothetical protein